MTITSLSRILARHLWPAPGTDPGSTAIAGASFAQQEPDLAKEVGLTERELSGWAGSGPGLFG